MGHFLRNAAVINRIVRTPLRILTQKPTIGPKSRSVIIFTVHFRSIIPALKISKDFAFTGTTRPSSLLRLTRHSLQNYSVPKRWLHVTPRRPVNPIIWVVLKPLGKVWAALWGRSVRKWWVALPLETRSQYKGLIGGMRKLLYGIIPIIVIAFIINYAVHYQYDEISGRGRFISLTDDQVAEVAQYEMESLVEEYEGKVLPDTDAVCKETLTIVNNILKANSEFSPMFTKLNWKLYMIDADSVENAFVLPNGSIFVFTGLLNGMENKDQLACVMGHEIAHVIMKHSAETLSKAQLVDYFIIVTMAGLWMILPNDGIAVITTWFYEKLKKLMIDLPFSRELESEADQVGLEFAARACYDVREAPAYWTLQDARSKLSVDRQEGHPFLSTHPTHATRMEKLNALVTDCMELRDKQGCPNLSRSPDPYARTVKRVDRMKSLADQGSALRVANNTTVTAETRQVNAPEVTN